MGLSQLKAQIARDYGTPAMVIDLNVVENNIARVQAMCDAVGVANRPHIKTHKSPVIAKMQIEAGAKGITCQKIGEVEVMVDAGIDDIFISYNLLGEQKIGRLGQLLKRAKMRVACDNQTVLDGLPEAGIIAGRPLEVMVECDTGRKRAGVETPQEAIDLAKQIAANKHLTFAGLMMYPPESKMAETEDFIATVRAGLREAGIEINEVSSGGTPNLANLGKIKAATEHRAGTCIFNDRMMMRNGHATLDDCALNVYATVVSRAGAERGILDSGSKTLTSDTGGGLDGYGLILEHPQARIAQFAEEHGFLDLSACNDRPVVGDVVRIIPNHVCVVVNMVDRLVVVRGHELLGDWPVAARGCIV